MVDTHLHAPDVSAGQAKQLLSYTNGTSTIPLLGLTIGDQFDLTVSRYPDNPALISRQQHVHWTYRELQAQVDQCARGLLHLGIQKASAWASGRPTAPNGPLRSLPPANSESFWSTSTPRIDCTSWNTSSISQGAVR
jgi:non-ribosomal peptide synthetase component F